MNTLFSSCMEQPVSHPEAHIVDNLEPLPFKYKVANAFRIIDFIVKNYAQPSKKQQYTFPRQSLRFLTSEKSHVPIIYFPSGVPQISQIMVYCHGSSSTLNNIYDFVNEIVVKYGIAVLAYDYTGDGESQKQFSSYEDDLKVVLAWVVKQGYRLNKVILCGFSLGSYSALTLQGQMSRILISPVCGVLSFLNGEAKRYEGERYDTISLALKAKSKSLIVHCSQELVHISHSQVLAQALRRNNEQEVVFHQITDKRYEHRSAPSYLFSGEGQQVLRPFLKRINKETTNLRYDIQTKQLELQLLEVHFHCKKEDQEHLK